MTHPSRIIDIFEGDLNFSEVKPHFEVAFKILKTYQLLVESALHVSEKEKDQVFWSVFKNQSEGFRQIKNLCDYCNQELLNEKILNFFYEKDRDATQIDTFLTKNSAKPFLVFRCGHVFHKKCLQI